MVLENVIIEDFDSPPQASGEKTADRQNSWLFDKKFYTTFMGIKMIVMAVQFHSRRLWVMLMMPWPNYDVMSGDLFSRKFHKIDRKIKWLEYTQKAIRMTSYLIKMSFIAYIAAFIDLLIKFRPNKVESNLYLWHHIFMMTSSKWLIATGNELRAGTRSFWYPSRPYVLAQTKFRIFPYDYHVT